MTRPDNFENNNTPKPVDNNVRIESGSKRPSSLGKGFPILSMPPDQYWTARRNMRRIPRDGRR